MITLDPLSLAVWYMDDGSRCRDSDIYLNTQQFTLVDQKQLLQYLKDMGLNATLNKDKIYHRIRFLKESVLVLRRVIMPFVIPSMQYKIE